MKYKRFISQASIIRKLKGLAVKLFLAKNATRPRVVEWPFVFRRLQVPFGAKILDFGCNESLLSIELASMGLNVIGIDLHNYKLKHPNFSFVKGDIREQFKSEIFDAVIAISTIEHVGLGGYGEAHFNEGDEIAVAEIYRILKKDGQLLLSVPFGRKYQGKWYRVYDSSALSSLLSGFHIVLEEYYRRIDGNYWIPVKKQDLVDVPSGDEEDNPKPEKTENGVVLIDARKKSKTCLKTDKKG